MTTETGDAFTRVEPGEPPAFNLQRWISRGHARVVKYVEVYLAAGLQADIEELDSAIVDARARGDDPSVLVPLAEQVEAMRAEMAESKTVFKFSSITSETVLALKALVDDETSDEMGLRIFAAQCVEPKGLTWEDFRDLQAAIGEGYFMNTVIRTAVAARDGGGITVPFSLSASAILGTRTPSAS